MSIKLIVRTASILCLLLALLGCNSVQPSDLTGSWVMKDSSRQVLPERLQKASAKILLNPDGTFVASEMPDLFYSPGRHDIRLEAGSGRWKVVVRDNRQEIQLDFYAVADWSESKLPYGTHLNFSRNWGEANLFYFLGDADEARRIEFYKK